MPFDTLTGAAENNRRVKKCTRVEHAVVPVVQKYSLGAADAENSDRGITSKLSLDQTTSERHLARVSQNFFKSSAELDILSRDRKSRPLRFQIGYTNRFMRKARHDDSSSNLHELCSRGNFHELYVSFLAALFCTFLHFSAPFAYTLAPKMRAGGRRGEKGAAKTKKDYPRIISARISKRVRDDTVPKIATAP